MNIRQFECFRAVMSAGTMTRAAENLGTSQPTVTNLIASLERELGFALFRRRKGRLQPTPEAYHFFEEVKRTLASFDQTIETGRQIRGRELGQIVVATYPGIAIHFLPQVIAGFLGKRPKVRMKLISRSSQMVREMMPTQQYDLGIAELPIDHPAVRTEELKFECVCALPAKHPLARKSVITPKLLDGVPFVSLFREHMTYFRLARAFADENATWNVVAETEFFATSCALVCSGAGVAIVDPVTAAAYRNSGMVTRPFKPAISYEIGLLHPADLPRSHLTEVFAGELKRKIAPYLAK